MEARTIGDLRSAHEELHTALRRYGESAQAAQFKAIVDLTERLEALVQRTEDAGGWITHEQAARYLSMSPDALSRLAKEGLPRSLKKGQYRYSRKAIDAWMENH